ncbi:DUF5710 domain-containing protein [Streptomyces sp. INA 01156]
MRAGGAGHRACLQGEGCVEPANGRGGGNRRSGPYRRRAPLSRSPYADKDGAKKQLGSLWDRDRRKWYVDAAKISREQAARWLPPPS